MRALLLIIMLLAACFTAGMGFLIAKVNLGPEIDQMVAETENFNRDMGGPANEEVAQLHAVAHAAKRSGQAGRVLGALAILVAIAALVRHWPSVSALAIGGLLVAAIFVAITPAAPQGLKTDKADAREQSLLLAGAYAVTAASAFGAESWRRRKLASA